MSEAMPETQAADWYARHGKMPRVFVPAVFVAGSDVALPDGPARHITRVLRMGEGAPLVLFDGQGLEAGVRLADVSRKQTLARVEAVWSGSGESPLSVHLGQAISKGDRMDYAIQKAVELGVAAITPLYTERGDVRLKGDREEETCSLAGSGGQRLRAKWPCGGAPRIHRCRYQHGLKRVRNRCA
ncbi:hypothetical protein HORIV_00600 [Vreelandella olivaria]|uniref:Ribosomal RNA small subunit methyltransferase E n=1 Tax=Vreelandella olivaria TaxID=390919 RepID=A0ABM7GBB1_9GAMM|nr:hypothetical protein HORIV_00600 [Halomonas olivaria]